MEFTVNDIAALLNGTVEGDGTTKVSNISKIDQGEPGTLTFLSNPAYTRYIYTTQASAVIVRKDFQAEAPLSCALIKVEDPYASLARLLNLYEQSKPVKRGIEQPSFISTSASTGNNIYVGAFAYIADKATIGNNCRIYPQAYIGENVVIGENTIIYAGAKIYADCKIGSNCIIHAGAVIGSDGFGFAPTADGSYSKIAQVGNVIIEDNVEIGANVAIDRATTGSTIIKSGTKVDNLVHIAHNVVIGENGLVVAQTGIAGSTIVGSNVTFAGQCGCVGHIKIGDNTVFAARSAPINDVPANSFYAGFPAKPHKEWLRTKAGVNKVPDMLKKIKELEKRLAELESK